jgi:multisubunit Na+/H+ antiporter MnhF subunit
MDNFIFIILLWLTVLSILALRNVIVNPNDNTEIIALNMTSSELIQLGFYSFNLFMIVTIDIMIIIGVLVRYCQNAT